MQFGVEVETPVAFALSQAAGNPLRCVSFFQIPGGELDRRHRLERQRYGTEAPAGIVSGVNLRRSGPLRVIDDTNKLLVAGRLGRPEQRKSAVSIAIPIAAGTSLLDEMKWELLAQILDPTHHQQGQRYQGATQD